VHQHLVYTSKRPYKWHDGIFSFLIGMRTTEPSRRPAHARRLISTICGRLRHGRAAGRQFGECFEWLRRSETAALTLGDLFTVVFIGCLSATVVSAWIATPGTPSSRVLAFDSTGVDRHAHGKVTRRRVAATKIASSWSTGWQRTFQMVLSCGTVCWKTND
jgi:hypothetical protein